MCTCNHNQRWRIGSDEDPELETSLGFVLNKLHVKGTSVFGFFHAVRGYYVNPWLTRMSNNKTLQRFGSGLLFPLALKSLAEPESSHGECPLGAVSDSSNSQRLPLGCTEVTLLFFGENSSSAVLSWVSWVSPPGHNRCSCFREADLTAHQACTCILISVAMSRQAARHHGKLGFHVSCPEMMLQTLQNSLLCVLIKKCLVLVHNSIST